MGQPTLSNLLRHVNRLLDDRQADGLTDADLLARFAENRDEAAFEVLVWRHGPMVHSLCRRLLRRREDADDAFQAAFLILVRKARSISKRISLGSWLYKVTYRVALEVQAREAKHAVPAQCDAEFPAVESADEPARRDLQRVIAEEVDRLPEKYRLPVVLCYLSGKTTEEAARRLGCPRGTVLSRLATARKRLHGRLVRRGIGLTAVSLGAAREPKAVAAPAVLVSLTVKAAAWLAAGSIGGSGVVSGPVLFLMQGALKTMFVQKMKWAAVVLVAAAMVGGGVGVWFRQPAVAESPTRRVREAEPALKALDEPRAGARTEETNRPIGSWERDVGAFHVTLRIEADRIYGTYTYSGIEKDAKITFVLDADYSVTKDNVLYGVLTGGDVEGTGDKAAKDEIAQAALGITSVSDCPFSFRYRVDGNVLSVRDPKFGGIDAATKDNGLQVLLQGRWKKKTETSRDAAR
jgi:RNA polymerase sigma factor (sigma-70 family)